MEGTGTTASRLQRLRVANGITQAELANAIGIAPSVISKVENQALPASRDLLERAARVLRCDSAYFLAEMPEPSYSRPWLRAYSDAPKRIVDAYVADSATAIAAFRQLQLSFKEDRIPTFDSDPNDDDAIEEIADLARNLAGVSDGNPVGNMTRAAERLGCVVLPMESELGRHLGLSLRIDDLPVMRVSRPSHNTHESAAPPGDRQRFTVAHELGHLVLHAATEPPVTAEQGAKVERQAHRFAAAFLTPAEPLLADLAALGDRVTLSTLATLKQRWGVAIKMLVVRLQQLGRIDDRHARSLYKQISARQWNKCEPIYVGNETAAWLPSALSKHFPNQDHQAMAQLANSRTLLGGAYFDSWLAWSSKADTADVLEFIPRHHDDDQSEPLEFETVVTEMRQR